MLTILGIWAVWNLILAPIHELSHLFAGWLAGQHVQDFRLIQHFWEGDFVHGHITWKNGTQAQYRLSAPAPYVADALMILLGFVLIRLRNTLGAFLGTLGLPVAFLRPIYDVATNYAADTFLSGSVLRMRGTTERFSKGISPERLRDQSNHKPVGRRTCKPSHSTGTDAKVTITDRAR